MNGFIRNAAWGTCLGGLLAMLTGCVPGYHEIVDPCWPERYNAQARHSVREIFNAQAGNGHALEQTVWNQYFEAGSDKLTKVGEDHLKYLARRKPVADPRVYLQTSHDAKGGKGNLEELKTARGELDNKRVESVKSYFKYLTNLDVDVLVLDVHEPGVRTRAALSVYVTPISAQPAPGSNAAGAQGGNTTTTGTIQGQQQAGTQVQAGAQQTAAPQQR